MAIFNKQKDLTIASIKENLTAIKYCLEYQNSSDSGCLGIPATILMCSIVDTIGSYYRGSEFIFKINNLDYRIEKAAHHFYILNHSSYFNLNLSISTIEDFYSTYRSKLTHNNSLPSNNYLYVDKASTQIFHLDNDGKAIQINLHALFESVDRACDEFFYHLEIGNISNQHKMSKELQDSSKKFSIKNLPNSPSPSGFTNPSEY